MRSRWLISAGAALSVCLLVVPAAAGQTAEVAFQRLDVRGLPEIAVYFTVVDADGSSVLGLAPDDLRVTLDGVEQPVAELRSALAGGEHLAVALLFDRSGSMKGGLGPAKAAALDFLSRLSQGDQAAIVAFDDGVALQVALADDRSLLAAGIEAIEPGRDTALYDAIAMGLDALAEATTPRRAVVVLSDGMDTRSTLERPEVIRRARDEGVPIYALGLPVETDAEALGELAGETGGTYLQATTAQELRTLYQLIAERLENQYFLRFVSTFGDDGAWHRLAVSVTEAGSSAQRQILASTGPGISGNRMRQFRRGVAEQTLLRWGGGGAIAGLVLGFFLLVVAKLGRPDAPVLTLVGLGIVVVAIGFGGFMGCVLSILLAGG